eukprot:512192_1
MRRQEPTRLAIVMVGLPARGKSTLSRKIHNHLSHQQLNTKIFNFGDYRRIATRNTTVGKASASFFDPENKQASQIREQCCVSALHDLFSFYNTGGEVGILDATNTTFQRRKRIRRFISNRTSELDYDVSILFIETICNDEAIIHRNIICGKLNNADYCAVEAHKAIRDFQQRIKMYEKVYCEVQKEEGSFIKVIDFGSKIHHHQINDYFSRQIFYFVMYSYLHSITPIHPNDTPLQSDIGTARARYHHSESSSDDDSDYSADSTSESDKVHSTKTMDTKIRTLIRGAYPT